jgi:hypothetical protein
MNGTTKGSVRRGSSDPWLHGEPALLDVMEDPIVYLLMRRDGLDSDDVWPLVMAAQYGLRRRLCGGMGKAA